MEESRRVCDNMTPFELPVDPEVNINATVSVGEATREGYIMDEKSRELSLAAERIASTLMVLNAGTSSVTYLRLFVADIKVGPWKS